MLTVILTLTYLYLLTETCLFKQKLQLNTSMFENRTNPNRNNRFRTSSVRLGTERFGRLAL